MKNIILVLLLQMFSMACFASSDVKRPDSYNYQRAMEAFNKHEYDESLDFFKKELAENNKNGYAYSWISNIYILKNEYGKALTAADKSLKLLPSKDKEFVCATYVMRGDVYLELADTAKAIADFDAAIKINPEYEDAIEKKADVQWEQKNYEASNAGYQRLISVNEGSAMGHMGYGRNLMEQKKWKEAIEQFSIVTKMYSDYSSGFAFRAQAYIGLSDWKNATDDIIKALEINQDNKAFGLMQTENNTFISLMTAKLKVEKTKEPGNAAWSYDLGILYENQKMYLKAIEEYKKSNGIEASSACLERISSCYESIGAYKQAMEYIDLAMAQDSTDNDLIAEKADILYYSGDTNGAIRQLDKFIEHLPNFGAAYYRRGFYKDNVSMIDDAIEDYNMSIALDSTYAYAYLGRADQYIKKGDSQLAMADYRMVTKLDTVPTTSSCAFYAYLALGEKDKGIAYLDSCMSKFPKDDGVFYDACCFYSRTGDTDKAISYMRHALDNGFRRFSHMELDDDLDAIRDNEKYKALIAEYKQKFAKEIGQIASNIQNDSIAIKEVVSEVPFNVDNGNTCNVKCSINELPLSFVFDTGASDISMSQVEATFMMKNGYLTKNDVVGKQYYSDANGNVNEGTVINLKHVNFGGMELSNIRASVVKNQKAPLLLGQSVFQKLGKIEIDNTKHVLKITRKVSTK